MFSFSSSVILYYMKIFFKFVPDWTFWLSFQGSITNTIKNVNNDRTFKHSDLNLIDFHVDAASVCWMSIISEWLNQLHFHHSEYLHITFSHRTCSRAKSSQQQHSQSHNNHCKVGKAKKKSIFPEGIKQHTPGSHVVKYFHVWSLSFISRPGLVKVSEILQ